MVRPVVERILGAPAASAVPVDEGGYSPAGRWVVRLADRRSAFVKAELEWDAAHGTAMEHLVYSSVAARCLPLLLGYDPGGAGHPRVLVTEDLSAARWGPPLARADVEQLAEAVAEVTALPAPEGVPAVDLSAPWSRLQSEPEPLVATGLVNALWLEAHLGRLVEAERAAEVSGDRLVHCDIWLQNWCRADRGAVIVDWAGVGRGTPSFMRAHAEAGVRAAGGPPNVVLPGGRPEWAAFMAGLTARYLTEQRADTAPRLVETQRREARSALRWACEELEIPLPEAGPAFRQLGPWRP